jgi:prepilin-type N-terminal cleavage/methylation domain-containing protein
MRGFTLVELTIAIVVIAFLGIFLMAAGASNDTISIGINGVVSERCIGGYKVIVGQDGQARQMMDEFGKGVRC